MHRRSFRCRYVSYAILSELTLGLHDLLLSSCAYDRADSAPVHGTESGAESFEFFVWSRCSSVATFVLLYVCVPSLRRDFVSLCTGSVRARYLALSCMSEALSLGGYYLCALSYGMFHQAAVVHTAEASLSQLLNLSVRRPLATRVGFGPPLCLPPLALLT